MHNIVKTTKILAFILLSLLVISCEEKDNSIPIEGTNSIVNYLEQDSTFTLFSKAIDRAGLYGTLDGNAGTYTVLAPDDEAMQLFLSEQGYNTLDDVPEEQLKRLVNYHILETLKRADNFITGYVQTLAEFPVNDSVKVRLSLYVSSGDSIVFNGIAKIVEGDVPVDNGILHKLDRVLTLPTVETFMAVDDNLKAFYDKITAGGIATDFETLLADPQHKMTIFVPNKNAVNEFFGAQGSMMTPTELDNIYRYHLLDTLKRSSGFETGYFETAATESYSGHHYPLHLHIDAEAGLRLNVKTRVVITDLMTINGSIQVIDSVLGLPTVETFVKSDGHAATFKAQLLRDDQLPQNYASLLAEPVQNGNAPFTVFAPNEQAFQNIIGELYPNANVELDTIPAAQMTAILDMHIVKNLGLRPDDFSNQSLNALGGTLVLDAANRTLTDPAGRTSLILRGFGQAVNGVFYRIDKVLLPN